MRYTNKHGLPDAFYRAVVNDSYDKGDSDFTATGLETPPRAAALLEQHDVEIDVSTRVAVIIGRGAHATLECAARPGIDIIEQRFYREIEVDGVMYKIGAQIDIYEGDTRTLQDWKTAKAFAFHKKSGSGNKPEWRSQLNIGKWVIEGNGLVVEHLRIIGLLKDWNKREITTPGYPPVEVMSVEIEVWPTEKTEDYIRNKIRALVEAKKELPLCSGKENWGGNRCGQWCDAASVCSQYQESLKTGIIQKVENW